MGFFDEAKEMIHTDLALNELDRNLKKAYKQLNKGYQSLNESTTYKKIKFEKVKEAIQQFKEYFYKRDFQISDSNVFIVASIGQRRAELMVNDTLDLTVRVYSHNEIISDHTLFLEDIKAKAPHFNGTIAKSEVQFASEYTDLPIQDKYKKSIEDIEKDLEAVNERLTKSYTPIFQYYDVINDEQYASLTDLLHYLNKELV
ncbi:hypothetical protein GCM10008935_17360 [Alkalibacillus silvisoli]|uniref:LXG domain-containing protein n=2 Tax=Alkalibacillus silvisoli TaxID=392823 RepID=A0ABP3JRR5_9BACI